ncbi:MAG: hypothetical protein N2439_11460 [Anaerolineae bacterium]|nr:hypothetical protein [Anaerolineae bacterium]
MILFVVLLTALTMIAFGLIGFLRVARAAIWTLIIQLIGLVLLRAFGPKLVTIANRLWVFFTAGGLEALASADPARGLGEVLGKSARGLVDPAQPAFFYLGVFYFFLLVGVLVGSLQRFKLSNRFSFGGLFVGLVNGYLAIAYSLAVFLPELAILPMPLAIKGMTPVAVPASIAPAAGGAVGGERVLRFLRDLGNHPSAHFVVAGLIVLFIFMATRLSAKKG